MHGKRNLLCFENANSRQSEIGNKNDALRLQDQAHAQERHECLLSQRRLVIEHQAAQAYGEAAAAEVRVAELVAEDSLQQGATLCWKSRDEHHTEQREMAANAEMALQSL